MISRSSLLFWALLTGAVSALATGLGAIPVHFLQARSKTVQSFASALAAGMMISASVFSLAQEGLALKTKSVFAPYIVIAGLLLGAAFFWATEKWVSSTSLAKTPHRQGVSTKSLLIFIAMFIHSIPEGIAIGVGFATGHFRFGMIMAMAISVHNIPEGIAVSLPLKAEGMSTRRCALASILTSLPQPLMAVPAALLTWLFEPLLPVGLGFAGGAMIYLVFTELIPEALENGGRTLTAWGIMLGLTGMLLITTLLTLLPIR